LFLFSAGFGLFVVFVTGMSLWLGVDWGDVGFGMMLYVECVGLLSVSFACGVLMRRCYVLERGKLCRSGGPGVFVDC